MFQAFSVIAAYVMTVEMVVYPNIHQGEDHSEGRLDCKAAIAWLTSISFPAALAGYSVRHTILRRLTVVSKNHHKFNKIVLEMHKESSFQVDMLPRHTAMHLSSSCIRGVTPYRAAQPHTLTHPIHVLSKGSRRSYSSQTAATPSLLSTLFLAAPRRLHRLLPLQPLHLCLLLLLDLRALSVLRLFALRRLRALLAD